MISETFLLGKLLLELTDHVQPVTALAFAPDGSLRLVSGSKDSTIKVCILRFKLLLKSELACYVRCLFSPKNKRSLQRPKNIHISSCPNFLLHLTRGNIL